MRIINIGGATSIIESGGKRMLTDPWLDDGIFHGAWYHYPPAQMGVEQVGHVDYIFISHIHEDHCSAGTIRHLNTDAELIIADKNPNFVERFLDAHGFKFAKVHKVKPRTPTWIAPNLLVDIVEADPANEMAYAVDSALVMVWDGFTVYNANDCQPYNGGLEYIKANYQVDLALLPYSGGSGYPSCYLNLTDEQKDVRAAQIRKSRLDAFEVAVLSVAPRWVMPFADQYVIAGSRAHLNRFVSHPPSPWVVSERFGTRIGDANVLLLNSTQSFDFDTETYAPDEPYRNFTEEDRDRYVSDNLLDKTYEHERFDLNPTVSLARLMDVARARLWDYQGKRNSFPQWDVYIDVPERGERFHFNLTHNTVSLISLDSELTQPYLRMVMPGSLLALILIGHISINIADAALFIDYERVPDRYEPELYVLLNMLRC